MCLLTFLPAGIMPDEDALLYGATYNDDGHGYAVVDVAGDRIVTGRGRDAFEMIEEFSTIREMYLDGPALFHSRYATDGLVSLFNVHPFEVGGDPRTVLAHNGIMPLRPKKDDPRSDTRLVAERWIPTAYGTLRRRRARVAFERWLTPYNKVVLLTVDRRFRGHADDHGDHAFILNESSGTWDSGRWYSNDGYKPFRLRMSGFVVVGGKHTIDDESDRKDFCWECGERTNFSYASECARCGLCFDCAESYGHCLCYAPGKGDPSATVTSDVALWRPTGLGGAQVPE
jgi:hypothetical protein